MITMKDIAQQIGVSRSTVSLVLNQNPLSERIRPELRDQINRVADELGYCRNEVARSVVTGKTQVLGFINYGLDHEVCGRILNGFNETAAEQNYYIKHINIKHSNSVKDLKNFARSVAIQCAQQRLAAVACCFGPWILQNALKHELDRFDIAMVSICFFNPEYDYITIGSDEGMAARLLVEHFKSQGHRKLAYVTHGYEHEPFSRIRHEAFLQAAKEQNLMVVDQVLNECQDADTQPFEQQIGDMFQRNVQGDSFTAVACGSDCNAYLVLRVAMGKGIKVPEDLSVTGFGNLFYSHFSCPGLTTIDQAFDQMGACAASHLIRCVHEPDAKLPGPGDLHFKLPVQLVQRNSTAVCRTLL
jgi:DNA-binding LacI/PurR family transcriptional regulator